MDKDNYTKQTNEYLSLPLQENYAGDAYSSDQTHEYLSDQPHQYSHDQSHEYSSDQPHQYSSDQHHQYSSDIAQQYSSDLANQYSSDQPHEYSAVQSNEGTDPYAGEMNNDDYNDDDNDDRLSSSYPYECGDAEEDEYTFSQPVVQSENYDSISPDNNAEIQSPKFLATEQNENSSVGNYSGSNTPYSVDATDTPTCEDVYDVGTTAESNNDSAGLSPNMEISDAPNIEENLSPDEEFEDGGNGESCENESTRVMESYATQEGPVPSEISEPVENVNQEEAINLVYRTSVNQSQDENTEYLSPENVDKSLEGNPDDQLETNEPLEPVEPLEPEDEPMESDEPFELNEPFSGPEEHLEPNEPSELLEPEDEPIKPGEPIQPGELLGPSEPLEPEEPVEPLGPEELLEPEEPEEPLEPSEPFVGPDEPLEPEAPLEPDEPIEPGLESAEETTTDTACDDVISAIKELQNYGRTSDNVVISQSTNSNITIRDSVMVQSNEYFDSSRNVNTSDAENIRNIATVEMQCTESSSEYTSADMTSPQQHSVAPMQTDKNNEADGADGINSNEQTNLECEQLSSVGERVCSEMDDLAEKGDEINMSESVSKPNMDAAVCENAPEVSEVAGFLPLEGTDVLVDANVFSPSVVTTAASEITVESESPKEAEKTVDTKVSLVSISDKEIIDSVVAAAERTVKDSTCSTVNVNALDTDKGIKKSSKSPSRVEVEKLNSGQTAVSDSNEQESSIQSSAVGLKNPETVKPVSSVSLEKHAESAIEALPVEDCEGVDKAKAYLGKTSADRTSPDRTSEDRTSEDRTNVDRSNESSIAKDSELQEKNNSTVSGTGGSTKSTGSQQTKDNKVEVVSVPSMKVLGHRVKFKRPSQANVTINWCSGQVIIQSKQPAAPAQQKPKQQPAAVQQPKLQAAAGPAEQLQSKQSSQAQQQSSVKPSILGSTSAEIPETLSSSADGIAANSAKDSTNLDSINVGRDGASTIIRLKIVDTGNSSADAVTDSDSGNLESAKDKNIDEDLSNEKISNKNTSEAPEVENRESTTNRTVMNRGLRSRLAERKSVTDGKTAEQELFTDVSTPKSPNTVQESPVAGKSDEKESKAWARGGIRGRRKSRGRSHSSGSSRDWLSSDDGGMLSDSDSITLSRTSTRSQHFNLVTVVNPDTAGPSLYDTVPLTSPRRTEDLDLEETDRVLKASRVTYGVSAGAATGGVLPRKEPDKAKLALISYERRIQLERQNELSNKTNKRKGEIDEKDMQKKNKKEKKVQEGKNTTRKSGRKSKIVTEHDDDDADDDVDDDDVEPGSSHSLDESDEDIHIFSDMDSGSERNSGKKSAKNKKQSAAVKQKGKGKKVVGEKATKGKAGKAGAKKKAGQSKSDDRVSSAGNDESLDGESPSEDVLQEEMAEDLQETSGNKSSANVEESGGGTEADNRLAETQNQPSTGTGKKGRGVRGKKAVQNISEGIENEAKKNPKQEKKKQKGTEAKNAKELEKTTSSDNQDKFDAGEGESGARGSGSRTGRGTSSGRGGGSNVEGSGSGVGEGGGTGGTGDRTVRTTRSRSSLRTGLQADVKTTNKRAGMKESENDLSDDTGVTEENATDIANNNAADVSKRNNELMKNASVVKKKENMPAKSSSSKKPRNLTGIKSSAVLQRKALLKQHSRCRRGPASKKLLKITNPAVISGPASLRRKLGIRCDTAARQVATPFIVQSHSEYYDGLRVIRYTESEAPPAQETVHYDILREELDDLEPIGREYLLLSCLTDGDIEEMIGQIKKEAEHRMTEHITPLVMALSTDEIERTYEHITQDMRTYDVTQSDSDEEIEEEDDLDDELLEDEINDDSTTDSAPKNDNLATDPALNNEDPAINLAPSKSNTSLAPTLSEISLVPATSDVEKLPENLEKAPDALKNLPCGSSGSVKSRDNKGAAGISKPAVSKVVTDNSTTKPATAGSSTKSSAPSKAKKRKSWEEALTEYNIARPKRRVIEHRSTSGVVLGQRLGSGERGPGGGEKGLGSGERGLEAAGPGQGGTKDGASSEASKSSHKSSDGSKHSGNYRQHDSGRSNESVTLHKPSISSHKSSSSSRTSEPEKSSTGLSESGSKSEHKSGGSSKSGSSHEATVSRDSGKSGCSSKSGSLNEATGSRDSGRNGSGSKNSSDQKTVSNHKSNHNHESHKTDPRLQRDSKSKSDTNHKTVSSDSSKTDSSSSKSVEQHKSHSSSKVTDSSKTDPSSKSDQGLSSKSDLRLRKDQNSDPRLRTEQSSRSDPRLKSDQGQSTGSDTKSKPSTHSENQNAIESNTISTAPKTSRTELVSSDACIDTRTDGDSGVTDRISIDRTDSRVSDYNSSTGFSRQESNSAADDLIALQNMCELSQRNLQQRLEESDDLTSGDAGLETEDAGLEAGESVDREGKKSLDEVSTTKSCDEGHVNNIEGEMVSAAVSQPGRDNTVICDANSIDKQKDGNCSLGNNATEDMSGAEELMPERDEVASGLSKTGELLETSDLSCNKEVAETEKSGPEGLIESEKPAESNQPINTDLDKGIEERDRNDNRVDDDDNHDDVSDVELIRRVEARLARAASEITVNTDTWETGDRNDINDDVNDANDNEDDNDNENNDDEDEDDDYSSSEDDNLDFDNERKQSRIKGNKKRIKKVEQKKSTQVVERDESESSSSSSSSSEDSSSDESDVNVRNTRARINEHPSVSRDKFGLSLAKTPTNSPKKKQITERPFYVQTERQMSMTSNNNDTKRYQDYNVSPVKKTGGQGRGRGRGRISATGSSSAPRVNNDFCIMKIMSGPLSRSPRSKPVQTGSRPVQSGSIRSRQPKGQTERQYEQTRASTRQEKSVGATKSATKRPGNREYSSERDAKRKSLRKSNMEDDDYEMIEEMDDRGSDRSVAALESRFTGKNIFDGYEQQLGTEEEDQAQSGGVEAGANTEAGASAGAGEASESQKDSTLNSRIVMGLESVKNRFKLDSIKLDLQRQKEERQTTESEVMITAVEQENE